MFLAFDLSLEDVLVDFIPANNSSAKERNTTTIEYIDVFFHLLSSLPLAFLKIHPIVDTINSTIAIKNTKKDNTPNVSTTNSSKK
ncbi:protein of unknown function [Lactiplantibacillus plantarum]